MSFCNKNWKMEPLGATYKVQSSLGAGYVLGP